VFGALRHDVLEELVADWVALVTADGGYRVDLARRFLGLEAFPEFRPGGRLEVYRGSPPLSDDAFEVVQRLAVEAMATLDQIAADPSLDLDRPEVLARMTLALLTLPLEAVAGDGGLERALGRYAHLENALVDPGHDNE
jgi:hypothetical protein